MKRGQTDTETCRLNGWGVGTTLIGDEGYGPSTIRISAIGVELVLAVCLSHPGMLDCGEERMWTLHCREWEKVSTDSRPGT